MNQSLGFQVLFDVSRSANSVDPRPRDIDHSLDPPPLHHHDLELVNFLRGRLDVRRTSRALLSITAWRSAGLCRIRLSCVKTIHSFEGHCRNPIRVPSTWRDLTGRPGAGARVAGVGDVISHLNQDLR